MAMRILLLVLLAMMHFPAAHAEGGRAEGGSVDGLDQQRVKTEQELADLRQAISLSDEKKPRLKPKSPGSTKIPPPLPAT